MAPAPALSLVVAIVSDTTSERADAAHLAECLDALARQVDPPPMEVIVPVHDRVDGIDDMRRQFPDARFVPAGPAASPSPGSREHHDVLRACGLRAAGGDVVALIEDCARPDPGFCANVVAAHRKDAAAIGGAIDNGIDRPLNWAVYFCDFGKYQRPLPPGDADSASDANVSYKRAILETVRPTWEESFREVVVNEALKSRGERLTLCSDIVVHQNRRDLRFGPALRERFIWGRSYARTRKRLVSRPKTLLYAALSPVLPVILLARMTATAWARRERFGKFVTAAPMIVLLLISWSCGEGVGYLTPGRAAA